MFSPRYLKKKIRSCATILFDFIGQKGNFTAKYKIIGQKDQMVDSPFHCYEINMSYTYNYNVKNKKCEKNETWINSFIYNYIK